MSSIIDSPSKNFSGDIIPVEFLVLHYTACTLEKTLEIFSDPQKKVCAHFVLANEGTVHDLGGFWNGPIRRGAHAGASHFEHRGKKYEALNNNSIGIEIVNLNGNIFPYPDAQYNALTAITKHLITRFPILNDPNRIVGHEQIAGFRGKVDPGRLFDWNRYYKTVYGNQNFPKRIPIITDEIIKLFEQENGVIEVKNMKPEEWSILSSRLESFVSGLSRQRKTEN